MELYSPEGGSDQSGSGSGPVAAGEVRLLTLNLGLPGLALYNRWRVALAPNIDERIASAPCLLAAIDADVLALQEVYSVADRQLLRRALRQRYPYATELPRSRALMGSGLMLLSRFAISDAQFVSCRGGPWWTGPLWTQGFLVVDVELPMVGSTRLINVHLAATLPFGSATSAASEDNRNREVDQLLAAAQGGDEAAILIGDFNTSEEIYPENYRRIVEAGYLDVSRAVNAAMPNSATVTWDAANPLNRRGRFRDHPSQRIDHVFVRGRQGPALVPAAARVVLQERSIATKTGEAICLSDHYGLLVSLKCRRDA